MPEETFSNPMAPPEVPLREDSSRHPLTNDDFRKLMMTPRVGGPSAASSHSSGGQRGFTHKSAPAAPSGPAHEAHSNPKKKGDEGKKKKNSFFKGKKEEEDSLTHILKKYRDRATERREGGPTQRKEDELEALQATSGYRAVAPDLKTNLDAAEKRKQMIEESKYLGGDMEHTHLVKGLDYALLQKVRSEITSKQKDEEDLEEVYQGKRGEDPEKDLQFKGQMAKNIYRVLFRNDLPKVNHLFAPKRMAYVVDLDDDETDIPTTLLRSKAECPQSGLTSTITPNDLVIQKLTQVLAYLRADNKKKKKDKTEKDVKEEPQVVDKETANMSIFDETGDYVPPAAVSRGRSDRESSKRDKRSSYFDKPAEETDRKEERSRDKSRREETEERGAVRKSKIDSRLALGYSPADLSLQKQQELGINPHALSKEEKDKGLGSSFKRDHDPLAPSTIEKDGMKMDIGGTGDSYSECYPDAYGGYNHLVDSDDEEADFSKMDLGNKKGPIRRWDFENEEDYEAYMSKREALPKAAFQYGVKMNDGRKTRKTTLGKSDKDERAKLDRDWQKIQNIITKRKETGTGGGESSKKQKV